LGGHVGPERRWRRVEFRLGAVESSDRLKASTKVKALAIPRVCGKVQPVPDEHTDGSPAETESEKKQRQGAPLVIDILIGIDYYYEFMTGRVRRTTRGAVAVESRLGGIVCGRTDSQRPSHAGVFLSKGEHSDDSTLRKFWEIKSLGDTFRRRHHCGRICSPEEGRPDLPNNYPQAKRRLLALQRRLDVRKEDRAIYAAVMRQYFDEGCAGSRSTEGCVPIPLVGRRAENSQLPPHAGRTLSDTESAPRAAKEVLNNMYMDDLATSCNSVEDFGFNFGGSAGLPIGFWRFPSA
ncbi:hypothetical protein T4B_14763, partial [Trichinella pseudospiralis]